MSETYEVNNLTSALDYIKISSPSVFKKIQSELISEGEAAEALNLIIAKKGVIAAFEQSGKEVIITSDAYNAPAIRHYLTTSETAHISEKYKLIERHCFSYCPNLKKITFDEGIEQINANTLCGNTDITEIIFPESLQRIGDFAFADCKNLKNVTFLNPHTNINPTAFAGTAWFEGFSHDFVIINDQLLKYNGNDENIIIPEGTIHIANGVFDGNKNIRAVNCPSPLKHIGVRAFAECINLQEITFNNGLDTISIEAFDGCSALKKVILPESIRTIGIQAFGKNIIIDNK